MVHTYLFSLFFVNPDTVCAWKIVYAYVNGHFVHLYIRHLNHTDHIWVKFQRQNQCLVLTYALVSEHPNNHVPTYNEKPSHTIGSFYSSKGRTNSLLMLIVLRINVQQAHKTVVCGVCSHTQALILENHKHKRKYDPPYIKYMK